MHKEKNYKYIAIGIIVATVVLFIGIMYTQINGDKIAKNTYVSDIGIGSLTKEEAIVKLRDNMNEDNIKLSYLTQVWSINFNDIDVNYDFDETVEKAYNLNRYGNIMDNLLKTIKSNFGYKNELNIVIKYDKDKLKEKLEDIKKDIDVEVKNASLNINGNDITISDEYEGITLDVESTLNKIDNQLQKRIVPVELVVKVEEPTVTKVQLSEVDTILGRYTTKIKASSSERISNIKIAAEKMNNYLMMPGDEFSYVNETGPYKISNGYKNAPVIVDGELQSGIAGGVCQLSSTLYNSVLYSGLEIVNIKNHTIPSSYVEKGRDAVVTDSGIDFVFKNSLDHPVYIKSYVLGSSVVTEIYGSSKDKKNIEISTNIDSVLEPTVKKVEDPTIEKDKEQVLENGRNGYTVSTYRIYKDSNGNIIEKEKIYTSYYPKKQKVIAVGTKEVEKIENNTDENQENIEETTTSEQDNNQNQEQTNNTQSSEQTNNTQEELEE